MIDMQALGRCLAQERERKGWTQQQLATASRVGQNQISRLESGRKPRLDVETLARLARALGVSLDHLAGLDEQAPEEEPAEGDHAAWVAVSQG